MEICGSWNREIAKPKREMVSADISEERIQGSHDHDFPATSAAQKVRAINRVLMTEDLISPASSLTKNLPLQRAPGP